GDEWATFFTELPRPWSENFGRTCLRLFREHHAKQDFAEKNFNPYGNPWFSGLSNLALSLPLACLAEARLDLNVFGEKGEGWQVQYVRQQIRQFNETVQTRLKIYEEIV